MVIRYCSWLWTTFANFPFVCLVFILGKYQIFCPQVQHPARQPPHVDAADPRRGRRGPRLLHVPGCQETAKEFLLTPCCRWTRTPWSRWPGTWTWWCRRPSSTRRAAPARCPSGRSTTPASSARATGFVVFLFLIRTREHLMTWREQRAKVCARSGASTKHHLAKRGRSTDLQRLPQDEAEDDGELCPQGGIPWSAG